MEFQDNVTPGFQQYYRASGEADNPWTAGKATRQADLFNQWAQMYYPNAFQAALLNYQNEYDKPINQMLRWQEAGLNPYSFQPMQSSSGSAGSRPGSSTPFGSLKQEQISNALKGVSTLTGAAKVASEIYDYILYGWRESMANAGAANANQMTAFARYQTAAQESAWASYWNGAHYDGAPDGGNLVIDPKSSPRARYMEASTNVKEAQFAQINSIIDTLYPSQVQANEARAALLQYQKAVMEGQNDAVLQINTGNEVADAILKMLCFKMLSTNFSFFGKF